MFTQILHFKKRSAIFSSPAGISVTKLSRGVWLVTSRVGTGKSLTFFHCVIEKKDPKYRDSKK